MKIEQVQKLKKQLDKTLKKYDELTQKKEKMDTVAKNDLNQIARIGIDHYYESYDPEYYNRKFDLYNIYKVTITDTKLSIDYDYNRLYKHPFFKRKYLFDYMFMQGYHGGDITGPNHPAPGIPWYRGSAKASNTFAFWTTPAVQTESPYDEIETEAQKYIDKAVEKYNREIIDPLNKQIDLLVNGIK